MDGLVMGGWVDRCICWVWEDGIGWKLFTFHSGCVFSLDK